MQSTARCKYVIRLFGLVYCVYSFNSPKQYISPSHPISFIPCPPNEGIPEDQILYKLSYKNEIDVGNSCKISLPHQLEISQPHHFYFH